MRTLRDQGIAIGYISHHLDEIEQLADSITILKDGTWVGDFDRDELSKEQIEGRMVGRKIGGDIYPPKRASQSEHIRLALHHVQQHSRLVEVSLNLYEGEILGVGGLQGSGGETLLRTIIGDLQPTAGNMSLNGQAYTPSNPANAWEQGLAYLPGDRGGEGLIVDFSVQCNLSLAAIPRTGPFVNRRGETNLVTQLIDQLRIKAASPSVPARALSGGNLQKIVLGKCIAPKPSVLLLNNPTRGIDVGARMHIYATIRKLADEGLSIMLLTEDLLELRGISDRIIVMRKGSISKVFDYHNSPSEEDIVSCMI